MDHNFIYTSNAVEGCPECLYCGFEFVDHALKIYNENPAKEEYYMGEESLDPNFDTSKITADWFHASIETKDKEIDLIIHVYDPAGEKPADEDMSRLTNLQITTDGDRYLYLMIPNTMRDPAILEMVERFRH